VRDLKAHVSRLEKERKAKDTLDKATDSKVEPTQSHHLVCVDDCARTRAQVTAIKRRGSDSAHTAIRKCPKSNSASVSNTGSID
jgi:hypothetical protein